MENQKLTTDQKDFIESARRSIRRGNRFIEFWLRGEFMERWRRYAESGVTEELYKAWSVAMRVPVFEWQEIGSYDTTPERADMVNLTELCESVKQNMLNTFEKFLAEHPELPTTALRPLIHEVIIEFHSFRRVNYPINNEEVHKEENILFDFALSLYRDGKLAPVNAQEAVATTTGAVSEAVRKV